MHEIVDVDEASEGLIHDAEGVVLFYNTALRSSYERIQAIYDKIQKIKTASTPPAPDPATPSAASSPTFQKVLTGTVILRMSGKSLLKKGMKWRKDWNAISSRSQ